MKMHLPKVACEPLPVLDLHSKNLTESDDKANQSSGQAKCQFCDKSYSNKSNLRFHQRNAHPFERLYKCSACEKCFEYRKQLRTHCRSKHTVIDAAQRYPCIKCDRTFKSSSNLRGHQIKLHSHSLTEHPMVREYRYECWLCHKT